MGLTPQASAELARTDSLDEIVAGSVAAIASEAGKLIESFGGAKLLPNATRTSLEAAQKATRAVDAIQSLGDALAHVFSNLNDQATPATVTKIGLMSATQVTTLASAAKGEQYITLYNGARLTV